MTGDRVAVLCSLVVLGVLWLTFGLVLQPGEDRGSCTVGLRPGPYGDALVPAHVAAYLAIAGLLAWSHPGRVTTVALAGSAVVVLVSFVWSAPIAVLGIVGIFASLPAGIYALVALTMLARGRASDGTARALLWLALFVGLPGTFMGAYFNDAGLFCF